LICLISLTKFILFFFLDKKEPKNQGCRTFWGSCFEACPRNTTRSFHSLRQYCLLQALAASFKTITFSQNVLRPVEIKRRFMMLQILINIGARAKPEMV